MQLYKLEQNLFSPMVSYPGGLAYEKGGDASCLA